MMKINRKWLEDHNACERGKEFFLAENKLSPLAGIKNLLAKEKFEWANWLLVRVLPRSKQVQYTIFAAELVLDIFELVNLNDNRPREAIAAAKRCIGNSRVKNKNAAYAASNAAYAAINAAANAANADTLKKIVHYGFNLLLGTV